MVGGDLKLSRCKQGLKCAMMGMKREKGPYQAKDNGDTKKDKKKDKYKMIRIELRQVGLTQYRLHVVP